MENSDEYCPSSIVPYSWPDEGQWVKGKWHFNLLFHSHTEKGKKLRNYPTQRKGCTGVKKGSLNKIQASWKMWWRMHENDLVFVAPLSFPGRHTMTTKNERVNRMPNQPDEGLCLIDITLFFGCVSFQCLPTGVFATFKFPLLSTKRKKRRRTGRTFNLEDCIFILRNVSILHDLLMLLFVELVWVVNGCVLTGSNAKREANV